MSAMPAPVNEPDEGGRVCQRGHAVEGDNLRMVKGKNGRSYPTCRTCRQDSVRRWQQRQRGEDVARLPHSGGFWMPKRQYDADGLPASPPTAAVFTMLPHEFASLVYAAIRDARLDPVTLNVLRRAGETMAVTGTPEHHAVALWVQSLIDLTCDAKARSLRLDVILARLFATAG